MLYATKKKHRIIVEVDEHNLDEMAMYLERRRDVENAKDLLQGYLDNAKVKPVATTEKPAESKYDDPAYIEKVLTLAEKHELDVEGKDIPQIVEELKSLKK